MSKENRTLTLMKVGTQEALTHFNAHASQDKASYDGDMSDAEEDDIEVVPDKVDDTQVESSKPVGAVSPADKEVQKATNKSSGGQTSKSADKTPTGQPSNKASSGARDRPICYDQSILTEGCRDKYPKDHISVHCVQQVGRVLLMSCFNMLPEKQKMLNIFFHMAVTPTDGLTLQGGEWPSMPWYPDLSETRAALCLGSSKFPRDSSLEFELYKTSHTPVDSILHTTLNFKGQAI